MTVILQDIYKPNVQLTPSSFKFEAQSEEDKGHKYAVSIDFFDEIDVEHSRQHTTGRGLFYVLRKKNLQSEYWPRLTKEKKKLPYLMTDFDKWVDEDEQDEHKDDEELGNLGGGMDFSQLMSGMGGGMGGMGGMPGMGGMGGMGGMPDLGDFGAQGEEEEDVEAEAEEEPSSST